MPSGQCRTPYAAAMSARSWRGNKILQRVAELIHFEAISAILETRTKLHGAKMYSGSSAMSKKNKACAFWCEEAGAAYAL